MKNSILVVPKGAKIPLGRYFNSSEMDCKCTNTRCKITKIDMDHMVKMNALREQLGSPIKVTSGYRCEEHNAAVGGSPKSQHKEGTATDIQVSGTKAPDISKRLEKTWEGGLGAYNTFTHLDSRGHTARWDYTTD